MSSLEGWVAQHSVGTLEECMCLRVRCWVECARIVSGSALRWLGGGQLKSVGDSLLSMLAGRVRVGVRLKGEGPSTQPNLTQPNEISMLCR